MHELYKPFHYQEITVKRNGFKSPGFICDSFSLWGTFIRQVTYSGLYLSISQPAPVKQSSREYPPPLVSSTKDGAPSFTALTGFSPLPVEHLILWHVISNLGGDVRTALEAFAAQRQTKPDSSPDRAEAGSADSASVFLKEYHLPATSELRELWVRFIIYRVLRTQGAKNVESARFGGK